MKPRRNLRKGAVMCTFVATCFNVVSMWCLIVACVLTTLWLIRDLRLEGSDHKK